MFLGWDGFAIDSWHRYVDRTRLGRNGHRRLGGGAEVEDIDEAATRLRHANAAELTAKDPTETVADGYRNFEMKWSGPDGVVIDISETGWYNGDEGTRS